MGERKPQSTYEEILASLGGVLDGYEVFHNRVLVGTYIRPERTASGLYLTDTTLKEDEYQGKAGVVLKKGKLAFVDDQNNHFVDDVEPGDWIVYRVSDGWPLILNGVHCRLLEDVSIQARVKSPAEVY